MRREIALMRQAHQLEELGGPNCRPVAHKEVVFTYTFDDYYDRLHILNGSLEDFWLKRYDQRKHERIRIDNSRSVSNKEVIGECRSGNLNRPSDRFAQHGVIFSWKLHPATLTMVNESDILYEIDVEFPILKDREGP
jgi:hypothetical protein